MAKRVQIKRFEKKDEVDGPQRTEKKEESMDEETQQIYRELEELLMGHGSRKVKKRVLDTSSRAEPVYRKKSFSSPTKKHSYSKKAYNEIDELVEELERALYGGSDKNKRVMEDQQYKERQKERI